MPRSHSPPLQGCRPPVRAHVRRRPAHASVLQSLSDPAGLRIDGQPEIEHHHATLRRDQHVTRLEIPMQFAGFVNRSDGVTELGQRRTQPRFVDYS